MFVILPKSKVAVQFLSTFSIKNLKTKIYRGLDKTREGGKTQEEKVFVRYAVIEEFLHSDLVEWSEVCLLCFDH